MDRQQELESVRMLSVQDREAPAEAQAARAAAPGAADANTAAADDDTCCGEALPTELCCVDRCE
jgi:hypothetical protein